MISVMKSKRLSIYSSIFLGLSFLLSFLHHNDTNLSSSPTWPDGLAYAIFPLVSIILAIVSIKNSEPKQRALNILLIITALLLIALFILMATSHCGFYTGKCR